MAVNGVSPVGTIFISASLIAMHSSMNALVNSLPLSLCKIVGAPKMQKVLLLGWLVFELAGQQAWLGGPGKLEEISMGEICLFHLPNLVYLQVHVGVN